MAKVSQTTTTWLRFDKNIILSNGYQATTKTRLGDINYDYYTSLS
jgi:hypothetical protein